jgi:hypothetical protein
MTEIFGPNDDNTLEAKSKLEKYLRASTEYNVKIAREAQKRAGGTASI